MVTCIIIVKIMASTGLKKIMSVVELEESGDACGIYILALLVIALSV